MTAAEDQVVTLLALFVRDRAGLAHGERDHDTFRQKVLDHADDEGFASVLDYYYALRYDDPDGRRLSALIDAIVVGETYFFREPAGLDRVAEHVVARAHRGLSSRVWCAACSTGEEPLSLATLLAEAGVLDRVEIVATDLSERHLARARRGEHGRRALRALPEGRPPWIRPVERGVEVHPDLRRHVDWRRANLVDAAQVGALGRFDAVVCRNVLIYFDEATVRAVAAALARALTDDGILVIGASESLLRLGTELECTEHRGSFLYRRAGART